MRFEDIKAGDYVGATTSPGPDGTLVALEVHYLAPTVPEGHVAWDLVPGSMMTNAKVGAVQATGKRELTLQYKDGTQKIVVPDTAPIVRAISVVGRTRSSMSVLIESASAAQPPIASADHWQPADLVTKHMIDRLAQC